ncbi:MAG: helix-turn-helix domain-containing protein [Brevundimonas sp.]|uniref:helix-turn-helix domain-containing protein n=1 Tax=Brevundimonas sp. TaxID=1871086 RepID=UPI004034237F
MTKSLHTERYAELLDVLKRVRVDAGLTQAELAARLNKPQSYISKLERGERRIDVIEFIDLISAVDEDSKLIFSRIVGSK